MLSAKAELYQRIDQLKIQMSLSPYQPINTISLLSDYPVDIEYHKFNHPGLCGVAMIGSKVDTIALNSNRDVIEQNFDCSHELMHLYMHRNRQDSFNCFTVAKPQQDSFLEWQANEGAAQFLVPYQDFIPRFLDGLSSAHSHYGIQEQLADYYFVSPQVIRNRISTLSYEIDQYRCGVEIGDLQLLSHRQQQRLGIQPTCYNAVCAFGLPWDAAIG